MSGYYKEKLSAERLKRCYELASARVRQYLDAEASYTAARIYEREKVLELGCGNGRFLEKLVQNRIGLSPNLGLYGIDTSVASLQMGRENIKLSHCDLICMDASQLAFGDGTFDAVICIQNGISAFHVDKKTLFEESNRVTKENGIILFSSYSEKFWKYRLEWFEAQSAAALLGPIDYDKTGNGLIICKDGFTATTISPCEFRELTGSLKAEVNIVEVDESSLICEIIKK